MTKSEAKRKIQEIINGCIYYTKGNTFKRLGYAGSIRLILMPKKEVFNKLLKYFKIYIGEEGK